jgi:hypothetical protein
MYNIKIFALVVTEWKNHDQNQGCGFESELDPDSIWSVDPEPDPYSESGSRRAKMTHKSRNFFKEISCFEVLDVLF